MRYPSVKKSWMDNSETNNIEFNTHNEEKKTNSDIFYKFIKKNKTSPLPPNTYRGLTFSEYVF